MSLDAPTATNDTGFMPVYQLNPAVLDELPAADHDTDRRPSAPHLSYSQLSMYLRCSMQYYYRYVEGLKERPNVSLSVGKGGHAALEWNTKAKIATGSDKPTDEVVQKASDFMDFYLSDVPRSELDVDADPGALKDRHLAATRVYRVRDAPTITPVGAEVEYNLDINKYIPRQLADALDAPVRPINMKIDVLYQDKDTHVLPHDRGLAIGIEDYKYVNRKKTQAEVNLSPQITTYLVAVHDLTGRWPTKAGLRMMHPGSLAKSAKPSDPVPDSIPLLREPEHMSPDALDARMRRLAYTYAQAERSIRAGIFLPVDDPITCSWCGFRDRCQASTVDDFEATKLRALSNPA